VTGCLATVKSRQYHDMTTLIDLAAQVRQAVEPERAGRRPGTRAQRHMYPRRARAPLPNQGREWMQALPLASYSSPIQRSASGPMTGR
jgi:hypothetical protein